MSRVSDAILRHVREAGHEIPGPDEHWVIERTRAGHHQRSEGAWSWSLEWAGPRDSPAMHGGGQIGSQWPAKECARAKCRVTINQFGQIALIPNSAQQAFDILM